MARLHKVIQESKKSDFVFFNIDSKLNDLMKVYLHSILGMRFYQVAGKPLNSIAILPTV